MDIDEIEPKVVIAVPIFEFGYEILVSGPVAGDESFGAIDVVVDGHLFEY